MKLSDLNAVRELVKKRKKIEDVLNALDFEYPNVTCVATHGGLKYPIFDVIESEKVHGFIRVTCRAELVSNKDKLSKLGVTVDAPQAPAPMASHAFEWSKGSDGCKICGGPESQHIPPAAPVKPLTDCDNYEAGEFSQYCVHCHTAEKDHPVKVPGLVENASKEDAMIAIKVGKCVANVNEPNRYWCKAHENCVLKCDIVTDQIVKGVLPVDNNTWLNEAHDDGYYIFTPYTKP